MRLNCQILIVLFGITATAHAAPALPSGFEGATWNMTVPELKKIVDVERIITSNGFNYAEHLEEDPEVYVRMTANHERIEYYFYNGKLYKIFIIYDRMLTHTGFYNRLLQEIQDRFGPPSQTFHEEVFGLSILHNQWDDQTSILDLRQGAGFIYQVRIDKSAAQEKKRAQGKKKGV